MCSIAFKTWLQAGLFSRSSTAVDQNHYFEFCTIEYLSIFKLKYELLERQGFIGLSASFFNIIE